MVRACCLGRNLVIHVPLGGLHDLIYAPPVVRACCLGRDLMIHVPPGGLNDLIYAPSGGAGLLFRPEFDDSCTLRWLKCSGIGTLRWCGPVVKAGF